MEITIIENEEVYQDEDFCACCAPTQRRKGLSPILKITLPETTTMQDLLIQVCPDCDGGAAKLGMR